MTSSCLGSAFQSVSNELIARLNLDHFHLKNELFTQTCAYGTAHHILCMVTKQGFKYNLWCCVSQLITGYKWEFKLFRQREACCNLGTLSLTSNESPLMTSAQSCFLRNVFSSRWASVRVTTDLNTCRLWVLDTKRELLAMQVAVSSLSPVNIQICNTWSNLGYKPFNIYEVIE
jgi:hypothetical protein